MSPFFFQGLAIHRERRDHELHRGHLGQIRVGTNMGQRASTHTVFAAQRDYAQIFESGHTN